MAQALRSKVTAYGLEKNVLFAGLVRNLPALYAKSELVVMPSTYEPLGMSQIEALGLGVPVVAGRVGGIPETVEDRRTGLLVAPGERDAGPRPSPGRSSTARRCARSPPRAPTSGNASN